MVYIEFAVSQDISKGEKTMFGRQRQPVVIPEEPALPEVPQPMRLSAVDLGDATLQQYEQVAQSIGFHNPALLEQQIYDFFFRNAICVYPYDKVSAYLDALVEVEKKRRKNRELVWCWDYYNDRRDDRKHCIKKCSIIRRDFICF